MIRIQNIYYMLAYAFQILNEEGYAKIELEDFEFADDLLAAILAKGLAVQIKRGLGREYIAQTEALTSPHGKIDISTSIKQQTMRQKRLMCEFDDFSENAYINQVLKATAMHLLYSDDVRTKQKKALKKMMLYFHSVDSINAFDIQWRRIRYNRNNATYKMLINICYLVIEGMLPTTQDGSRVVKQFRDNHLHRLYEKFVREYYRKHYPEISVSAAHIDWDVDDGITELLPAMKSDITLEYSGKTLIIDTKYYGHTLQSNPLFNNRTIHSANMYQIFTYVKNRDKNQSGDVSGMLLYAKTEEEITPDNSYLMGGNRISVKTLDLDKDFSRIRKQLDGLIGEWTQR